MMHLSKKISRQNNAVKVQTETLLRKRVNRPGILHWTKASGVNNKDNFKVWYRSTFMYNRKSICKCCAVTRQIYSGSQPHPAYWYESPSQLFPLKHLTVELRYSKIYLILWIVEWFPLALRSGDKNKTVDDIFLLC